MTGASSPIQRTTRGSVRSSRRGSVSISSSSRIPPRLAPPAPLPVPVDDAGAIEVVRRQLDADAVAREDPDPETSHLAGHVAEHDAIHVVELHAEHRVRQGFDDFALEFDLFFL